MDILNWRFQQEQPTPLPRLVQLLDNDRFQVRDLLHFKLPFWLLVASCLVTYMSVFPYGQTVSGLLQYKFNVAPETSAQLFGIPYIISACLCPFLGFGIFMILSSSYLFMKSCKGAGKKTIEMNFLPDIMVHCDDCDGLRYNRETLDVRFKGKSISDVLNLTIDQAVEFFENIPKIIRKIRTLKDVGLGYITLGQSATTLSGGEAQRIKLASELSKKSTGNTFYILDEPTTGLHFQDIKVLLDVIDTIVEKGNSVLIIEHNLDVIKTADYIVDMGPEGGVKGGKIIAEGKPEEIVKIGNSYTGKFLKPLLN